MINIGDCVSIEKKREGWHSWVVSMNACVGNIGVVVNKGSESEDNKKTDYCVEFEFRECYSERWWFPEDCLIKIGNL